MALSQSELYTLAKSVGLTDSRAKVAAAIAMAESRGNPNAHNTTPPDDSYGLWQINMLGSLGPSRRKQLGLASDSDLYVPQVNARAMAVISSNGGNFTPWSTYTNGSYQQFMSSAVKDESSTPGWLEMIGKAVSPIANIPNPGDAVADLAGIVAILGKAAVWGSNPQNWVRVGYVVGGGVITVLGLYLIVNSTQAGRTVTKTATRVAAKGKLR